MAAPWPRTSTPSIVGAPGTVAAASATSIETVPSSEALPSDTVKVKASDPA
ncbi:MAG: hypothetical protein R2711_06805 [Acidimicrobiales bacterium]